MVKRTFLITAGPTLEPIDPVRFLSNRSTGKMGYALAQAAIAAGHDVILISGPTHLAPPEECLFIAATTAKDMEAKVLKHYKKADIIIKTAAVADYRPVKPASQKIKKTRDTLTLKLVRNPDILKKLGQLKRPGQTLVGFAAETQNLLANARKKMREKNLDWIVLNDVSRKDIGFGSDQNAVTLLHSSGKSRRYTRQSKTRLAQELVRRLLEAQTE